MRRNSTVGTLAFTLLLSLSQGANFATAAETSITNPDAFSDFIVVFEPEVSRSTSNKIIENSGGLSIRNFAKVFNGTYVYGQVSKMQALAKNSKVLLVEENFELSISAIQITPPWGLDRIDQQSLPLNSNFDDRDLQGVNTYSYVVDTGIDASNIEFEGRVTAGYTSVSDGGGSTDCHGHGTHVAGTIGSRTFGVAKKTTLVPVRVLDCGGNGYNSSVIAGLNWIAANHSAGDLAVVNMSLGGSISSALDEAVANLISQGIPVVVAAGNDNLDACNFSPARAPDAITVGATGSGSAYDDVRASYSNYGTCLDIFAPGTSISSTWLGTNGSKTISGTSMAAPHVAGIAARLLGQYPGLTPAQIVRSIKTSSTKNLVTSAGAGSPNQLAYLYVEPDITNVSLTVAGSAKTATRRQPITLSAVSSVAGKITFRSNGKTIPGCKRVPTISLTATCQWRSSVTGSNQLSAVIIPTEIASNEIATSSNYSISVLRRTGPRQ